MAISGIDICLIQACDGKIKLVSESLLAGVLLPHTNLCTIYCYLSVYQLSHSFSYRTEYKAYSNTTNSEFTLSSCQA